MANVPHVQGTGINKRKLKKPSTKGTKFSTEKGGNKGRPPQMVSYCPYCPAPPGVSLADPEKFVHVAIAAKTKVGTCKNGHSWTVGGASHSSTEVSTVVE